MRKKLPILQKIKSPAINFKKNRKIDNVFRIYFLPVAIVIMFLLLTIRLFHLTIVKGSYYRYISEKNRLKEITIEAPRGKIIDRKGFVIVQSQSINAENNVYQKRVYDDPYAFSHLIGYQLKAAGEDIKNDLCQSRLKLNDKLGKEGLEKIYECHLRGKKGKKLIEVDAQGNFLKIISITPPQEGNKIQLSIDAELQKKTYQLFSSEKLKDKKISVIASVPKTGEIIILTSFPSFSLEDFENNNQENIKAYLTDDKKPLFNRALKGVYPPGSIFKLIVASAALEDKIIDEKFEVEDTGVIAAGKHTFGNWYFLQYGKTEGLVDVLKAIKRSNDIFFYKVGEKLGQDKIKNWAEKFGLGKSTAIQLNDETGLIPSSFWKKEIIKESWYLGDTYNLSIGQGYILTTPIQINFAAAVFANAGYLCQPQLLKINNNNIAETTLRLSLPKECHSLNISQKTINIIREGMKQVCSEGGTGWPFFDFKVPVGCKTGTAQSHLASGLPHAWFTVFAPFEKPEIVLTVLVEEGGEGSNIAAPIAKEILNYYFEKK